MTKRWQETLSKIPETDQIDAKQHYPLSKMTCKKDQANPEYSQACYLAIRKNENQFWQNTNAVKPSINKKIESLDYEEER